MSNRRLRIWWIPQVPGKPFTVDVANFVEAKLLLDTLASYDAFQFENNIKPDYCNVGGLQEWSEEEDDFWDWHPDEEEDAILDKLFGPEISCREDPLRWMTMEQVRKFQDALDIIDTETKRA